MTIVATDSSSVQTRILTLKKAKNELHIPVPMSIWAVAEDLRQKFQFYDAIESGFVVEENVDITFCAAVLDFVLKECGVKSDSALLSFLNIVINLFDTTFLKGNNVHSVIRVISGIDVRRRVLRVYYQARLSLLRSLVLPHADRSTTCQSALINSVESGRVSLMAVFGGQGSVDNYFDELDALFYTYAPFLSTLLEKATAVLNSQACSPEAVELGFTSKGLDVLSWLRGERPSDQYMVSAPISLPLIGLIQLCHYWISLKVLELPPGQLRTFLQ